MDDFPDDFEAALPGPEGNGPAPLHPRLIKRTALLHAVALVLPGMAGRDFFDQATSLGIKNGRVFTYNDEVSISHEFPELGGIEGAVNARYLCDTLSNLTSKNIYIEFTPASLILRSDNR